MQDSNELKEIVKEKYGEIAKKSQTGCGCGCGTKNNKVVDYTIMKDEYTNLDGYVAEADLGLGCGLPTEYANIKEGDTVVDLGSGAGNDVFVARAIVGGNGKVIGIDMTEEMIAKANLNRDKLGFTNVEFKLGDIEDMPVENDTADVVVSNCVLNLVPDKKKAFAEIYRILKHGGHFSVSDIVIKGELPERIKKSAEMYAGCVAGAVQQDEYLSIINLSGFKNVVIQKTKQITVPENIMKTILSDDELKSYRQSGAGIFSITVSAYKD
jgi:ubiquinone/menaquinone biosynthesis C-methylase UbiE